MVRRVVDCMGELEAPEPLCKEEKLANIPGISAEFDCEKRVDLYGKAFYFLPELGALLECCKKTVGARGRVSWGVVI